MVKVDHQPLKALMEIENPTNKLARWIDRLNNYKFTIEYRKGTTNGNADALSRMMDNTVIPEDEIPEETIMINAIHTQHNYLSIEQLSDDDIKWLYDLKQESLQLKQGRSSSQIFSNLEQRSYFTQWDRMRVSGRNIYRECTDDEGNLSFQYVVPKAQRIEIFTKSHDTISNAHLGVNKTLEKIRKRFYWPKMEEDVNKYIQSCESCQMNKCSNQSVIAPLTPIQTTRPFEIVTTDIMGPLEITAQNNKYILVVCDHFTKWVELFAIKSLSAEEAADKLMQVIYRHSAPEAILSDQGTNFQSNLLSELWELLDKHKLRTTPYHPQCDGLTERFNRTLQPMIAAYLNERKDDWDDKLAALQFAYNTSVHATTNCSPFELVYGRIPKLPIDLIFDNLRLHTELELTQEEYSKQVQRTLTDSFKIVTATTNNKVMKSKLNYDRKVRTVNYQVNEQVWLNNKMNNANKKFSAKWIGPYIVINKMDRIAEDCISKHWGLHRDASTL